MTRNIASQPTRKWFGSIILLFIFMMGFGMPAMCTPKPAIAWVWAEDSQPEAEQVQPGTISKMEESWQEFLQAYNKRNLQEIDNTLNNLLLVRRNSGFANATCYSLALLALARYAHERHDDTGAMTLIDKALHLSPDYSFPYQAKSQLYASRKQWLSSLNSCFSGIKILFSNYLERLQLFAAICFVFSFLPLWLFLCFHSVLSLKYFRALRESWERHLDKKSAAIILFAVLLSGNLLIYRPTLLLPGLFLLFMCFFPFYSFREKICSFLCILFLVISPFAYLNGMKIIDSIENPFFQSAITINFDSYDNNDQQNIIQPRASMAERRLQLFSQAVVADKQQNTVAAIMFLEKLAKLDPHPTAALYNNLGNYYYKDGRIEASIAAYKKAISIDPSSGIYHYNLSHAYIKESFSLTRSEASFIQAWKLSPEIINRQLAKGQKANEPVLVHEPLPWSYTYHYVTTHSLSPELKSDFFDQYFSPWGGTVSYLAMLGIIVCIMGILWIKIDSSKRFCPLCGIRFHGIGRISDACPSCLHISRQAVSDSFTIRQRKKITSFSWLVDGFFFLAGFVVPGTYQLALGQTVRGTLMLCGSFAMAGSIILLHERMLHIALFPPGSAWGPLFMPLLFLIVSCLANFTSWRQRKQQRLILKVKS